MHNLYSFEKAVEVSTFDAHSYHNGNKLVFAMVVPR